MHRCKYIHIVHSIPLTRYGTAGAPTEDRHWRIVARGPKSTPRAPLVCQLGVNSV